MKKIASPDSKLGVLIPGLGAVATTFIAGVDAIQRGLYNPFGSLTQMGTIRLGKRTEGRSPLIKDFVPPAPLDSFVFGAWDVLPDDGYEAARKAKVLNLDDLENARGILQNVKPMKAVFNKNYVKNIDGSHFKTGKTKWDLAQQLMEDIAYFRSKNNTTREVMIWCASTEVFIKESSVHQDIAFFEMGLKENHLAIAHSMIYAYAALMSGVPFINGAPNLTVDIPALTNLSIEKDPLQGKISKPGRP